MKYKEVSGWPPPFVILDNCSLYLELRRLMAGQFPASWVALLQARISPKHWPLRIPSTALAQLIRRSVCSGAHNVIIPIPNANGNAVNVPVKNPVL